MASKKNSQKKVQTIHVKLDYSEAKQGKKDVLISEMSLLKLSKSIKKYRNLRIQELDTKQKIYKSMIEIEKNLTRLQKLIPMPKIPKLIEERYFTEEKLKEIKETSLPKMETTSIEQELEDIQRKLKALQ